MKLSKITIPAALAVIVTAETKQFEPFDKSQLAPDSFFEQFDSDDWAQLWKISKAKKDNEFSFTGEWAVEESIEYAGFSNDKGLVLKTKAAHHAIHATLPTPFINTNNTLVLQYEVKLQEGLNCGGAYIKLLAQDGQPNVNNEFNSETPYQIMFGPDKCGATNRVHFILRRKNPNTGEYEEKHLAVPPVARSVKTTTLYSLIIEPNQEFQIRINGDVISSGNLLDADVLKPPLNPPKEVIDVNDTKPEDWDDRVTIADPDQVEKPTDWDENAPYLIPNPEQTEKPASWDEDAPEYIYDPDAVKPEDWDDEEDGEWVAPLIFNPECEVHGCGPWEPELIPNPEFKGKWTRPSVKNPNYKGEWEPRLVANPDYHEDLRPSDLEPIGALGFELWSMQSNILFDNVYLGHSIEEAELIGNETFVPKIKLEQQAVIESAHESHESSTDTEKPVSAEADLWTEWLEQAKAFVEDGQLYVRDLLQDPKGTVSERPIEGGLYAIVVLTFTSFALSLFKLVLSLVTGGNDAPVPGVERKSHTQKDVEETKSHADASGAELKTGDVRKVSKKL